MPRRNHYGHTPACHLAFCLGHPVRRHILLTAAQEGRVHALDVQREFPEYCRTSTRDVLHVMRDRGVLRTAETIADCQGKPSQVCYRLTEQARAGLTDLSAFLTELSAALEVPRETDR